MSANVWKKSAGRLERLLSTPNKRERRLLVAAFAVIGFVIPMIYGFAHGIPAPHFHDEFGYLLGADTFAHGRLANPTPEFWEHFEAPQFLIRPTYASRYPPAQSVFLAIGQVAFGHPIFGVWLSCGLAAAALYWMLLGWTKPAWAALGATLLVLLAGTDYYWAQGYWGGMVAFSGGALFFGAFRRLVKERDLAGSALLLATGGVLLVNSRPFEGTMTMLPALLVLLVRIIRPSKTSYAKKLTQIVLPGIAVGAIAISMMGLLNYRVTGSATRFPYTEHQARYFSTPLFIFQSPTQTSGDGTERLKRLYASLNTSDLIRNLDQYDLPNNRNLYPVYAFGYMILNLTYGLLYPPLMIFLAIGVFVVAAKSRWSRFVLLSAGFTLACVSFAAYWDFTHYIAPLGCLVYLLVVQSFRCFWNSAENDSKRKLTAVLALLLIATSLLYEKIYPYEFIFPVVHKVENENFDEVALDLSKPRHFKLTAFATQYRRLIETTVAKDDKRYLVLVTYDPKFTVLDEILFNKADIDNAKIIWAQDLGEEKNRKLLAHYADRTQIAVKIDDESFDIAPIKP